MQMANEPRHLGVYFEGQPVGMVAVDAGGRFTFEYAPASKSNRKAFAISRSLPLQVEQHYRRLRHSDSPVTPAPNQARLVPGRGRRFTGNVPLLGSSVRCRAS